MLPTMFNVRFASSNPALQTRTPNLDVVLDWSNATPAAPVSLTLRHGASQPHAPPSHFMSLAEVGDGLGAIVAGPSNGPGSYLRLDTRGTERLRVQDNVVTVAGQLHVSGGVQMSNLVHDWLTADPMTPASSLALAMAYSNLFYLITYNTWQPGSSNSSNIVYVTPSGQQVVFIPYSPNYQAPGISYATPAQIAPEAPTNLTQFGALGCTMLYVADGGALYSPSYCNLIQDAWSTSYTNSPVVPPSAQALYDAYSASVAVSTSNLAGALGIVGQYRSNPNGFDLSNGAWLCSTPDGAARVRFGPDGGATELAAGSNAAASAFTWLVQRDAASGGALDPVAALSPGGTLSLAGALSPAAGYCNLPAAGEATPGVVPLSSSVVSPDSNAAASAAALAFSHDYLLQRMLAYQSINTAMFGSASNSAGTALVDTQAQGAALVATSNAAAFASNGVLAVT